MKKFLFLISCLVIYSDIIPGSDTTRIKTSLEQDSAYQKLKDNNLNLPTFIKDSKFNLYDNRLRRLNPPNKWHIAKQTLQSIPKEILLAPPDDLFQRNLALQDVGETPFVTHNSIYSGHNISGFNYYTSGSSGQSLTSFNLYWLAVQLGLKEDISNIIDYTVDSELNVNVGIYDLEANLVRLIDERTNFKGDLYYIWDYFDDFNNLAPKGYYLCLIKSNGKIIYSKTIVKPN